ncbi:restriction endonuclease [Streptomyces sp. AgN23]|uniref:restriction endonuclease n=1 Tax=Streptomyces TaxID=1883 RepID=UPI001B324EBD|nr:restriction endonuclease [Streptomyces sp. AgN23]QTI91075.1 restriction endonuclease [Streptomyces sp. AgN23]
MFDEDGSLDPVLKFSLYAILTLAAGKMLWEWLTEDVSRWITVDLWGLIADHPWWTGLIVAIGLSVLLLLGRLLSFLLGADIYVGQQDTFADPSDDSADPDVLTFKMKQLSAMSATGFEQACTDLLARDGFRSPRRVGGAGDLGVDVTARDDEDRLLILQCKQYQNPVASGHVQKFNGTARLHHGADLPIMIALNSFTQPAVGFAQHHQLILMGRPELKKWAHGQHLYDVLGIQTTTW